MIEIVLYSGVDFAPDWSNVHVTPATYIERYERHTITDVPRRMPPQGSITLSTIDTPEKWNYLCYKDPELLGSHPLFYFISAFVRDTPTTTTYQLTLDPWATMTPTAPMYRSGRTDPYNYALRTRWGTIAEGHPELVGATGGDYIDKIPTAITGDAVIQNAPDGSGEPPQWRFVVFLQYLNKVITSLYSRPTTYVTACAYAHQFIDQNFEFVARSVLPDGTIDERTVGAVTAKYQCVVVPCWYGQEGSFTSDYSYILRGDEGASIPVGGWVENHIHTATIPVGASNFERVYVGVPSKRIPLTPNDTFVNAVGTSAYATVAVTLDRGCSVTLECNGTRVDITEAYECAVVNDPANSYFVQNKIPTAINGITSIVGAAGAVGLAAINPTSAATLPLALGGAASNIASMYGQIQSINASQVSVSGGGDGFTIGLVAPYGLLTYTYVCSDTAAVAASADLYGHKWVAKCPADKSVRVPAEDGGYYIRFGECVPIVKYDDGAGINPEVYQAYADILKRGTRVWVGDMYGA